MKLLLILASTLVMSTAVCAFQNEPDGFRGLKWGESIDPHASNFTRIGSGSSGTYYLRRDDKRRIGGARIKTIFIFSGKISSPPSH